MYTLLYTNLTNVVRELAQNGTVVMDSLGISEFLPLKNIFVMASYAPWLNRNTYLIRSEEGGV